MTNQSTCMICGNEEESVLHVMRDCHLPHKTWISIGISWFPGNRFNCPLQTWVEINIRESARSINGVAWPLLFLTACKTLWYSRNQSIFEGIVPYLPSFLQSELAR